MAREVLILGATGKIAGHAIDALLANGNDADCIGKKEDVII